MVPFQKRLKCLSWKSQPCSNAQSVVSCSPFFFEHIGNSVVSKILFFYDIGTLKAEWPKCYVTFGWGCYILENL